MSWPASLLDASYAPLILGAVTQTRYELEWTPITSGRVEFLINARPLRVDGVFVNVSATIQQQAADALGAILPTAKMCDLAYAQRGATIYPVTMPIASTASAMIAASQKLDNAIGSSDGCCFCQKTWILSNSLSQTAAANYGFLLPSGTKSPWQGIACYPSVTNTAMVIQQVGTAHNAQHTDYSQIAFFVHRDAKVDGNREDIASILTDKTLASLVSHEGAITVPGLRQPGVPAFACPLGSGQTASLNFAVPAGMCPLPPVPTNVETTLMEKLQAALPWALGATAVVGAGAAVAWSQGWLPWKLRMW